MSQNTTLVFVMCYDILECNNDTFVKQDCDVFESKGT